MVFQVPKSARASVESSRVLRRRSYDVGFHDDFGLVGCSVDIAIANRIFCWMTNLIISYCRSMYFGQ